MPSIGNLFATITANAQQFIAEFARADNEARRKSASINREVDKLTKDIKGKFSLSKFGGDILKGAGLGSGFAVLQTASGIIADNFREAAAAAKAIQEAGQYALKAEKERALIGRGDDAKLAFLQEQLAIAERQRAKLEKGTTVRAPALGPNGVSVVDQLIDPSNEDKQKIAGLTREIADLQTAIAQLNNQLGQGSIANKLNDFFGSIDRKAQDLDAVSSEVSSAIGNNISSFDLRVRAQLEQASKVFEDRRKAAAKEVQDLQTAQLEYAQRFGPDIKAIKEIGEESAGVKEFLAEQQERIEAFGNKMFQVFDSIGDRAAGTFADLILDGENAFDSLVNMAARAGIEMIARLAVINPIMNSVLGLTGASILPAFFGRGAPAAEGGYRPADRAIMVGEKGPELFMPRVGGTIVPNRALAGGGGGDQYYVDARGADTTAVQRLEATIRALNGSIEYRAIAAVRDADRRRK